MPQPASRQKGFSSYLAEFIVLSLAVAFGIFLDGLRKDYFGKKNESLPPVSIAGDLRIDSVEIERNISVRNKRYGQLDSMIILISQGKVYGFENELYYFARCLSNTVQFSSIRSVKRNDEDNKIITDNRMRDSLGVYDKLASDLMTAQRKEAERLNQLSPFISRIFNPYEFEKMVRKDGTVIRPYWSPFYRNTDMDLMKDFVFYLQEYKNALRSAMTLFRQLKEKAKGTLAFLELK